MDYKFHYDSLIKKAKSRKPIDGYKERHHIIPRCMGGTDDIDNLVDLTAREHFIAHQLLVKIYPSEYKLALAARLMTKGTKFQARNNREFEWLRIAANKANGEIHRGRKRPPRSKEWCDNISKGLKGNVLSTEHKAKISKKLIGQPKSAEMKANMSKVAKNRTKEHQDKLNKANSKPRSVQTCLNIKEAVSKLPDVTCPWCGKTGRPQAIKSWHFDYCKENPNGLQRKIHSKK